MFKILFAILALALFLIPQKKASRSVTALFFFATFLLMGLRNMVCYQDTIGYVKQYESIGNLQWGKLITYFNKDVVFWYVAKAINLVSNGSYTVWFLVISFVYIASIYNLVKKESALPAVSALILIVIELYYFAFTGMRQTLALAFIALAIYFLVNNEMKKAAIMILVASLFHLTAIVFLIALPLCCINISKKTLILYTIGGFVIYFLGNNFSSWINSITITDRFEYYADSGETLNFMAFFIKLLLLVSSYIFLGNARNEHKNNILIHLAIMGVITQSLSAHLAEMFRISMYFSIAYIVLFANSLVEYKKRTGRMGLPIMLVVMFFAYILLSNHSIVNLDYLFFFESPVGLIY